MQGREVEGVRAFILILAVLDHRVVGEGKLGDRVGHGRASGEADVAFDDGGVRAALGDDEIARVGGSAGVTAGADEKELDRLAERLAGRNEDESAVEEGLKPRTLLVGETVLALVRLRIGEVEPRVCDVEIAAEDHRLFLVELFAPGEERGIPMLMAQL